MEFYSATKKNEILSFIGKWMELENILSEVSQFQKAKGHIFTHMWNIDPIQIQQYYEKQDEYGGCTSHASMNIEFLNLLSKVERRKIEEMNQFRL
jgi:hypothetical protein